MISEVNGKVIWTLKVEAPHLINGNLEPLDEILAYWYPSHKAFLSMINSPHRKENFELRKKSEGDNFHVVIPNWTVNYSINWLCSQSQGIDESSGLQDSFYWYLIYKTLEILTRRYGALRSYQ